MSRCFGPRRSDNPRQHGQRNGLARLLREFGITANFVTHDQTGAMAITDRVTVMPGGPLTGTAETVALLATHYNLGLWGVTEAQMLLPEDNAAP